MSDSLKINISLFIIWSALFFLAEYYGICLAEM